MTAGYLELREVTKRFQGVDEPAVKGVSLSVAKGEFLTLLGPSGSGKTTTLNIVAGFEEPDSGSVAINGKDVTFAPPQHRNLSMVFQNYALFPHLTVYENVAFPLRIRKEKANTIKERVRAALELVHLISFTDRKPGQLSGGQQQRVALARAVVFSPDVLLMDEPLGALDKKLREQMQYEIKRIQRLFGMTVIYVTHDQSEALTMSDRIAVMKDGRIDQLATPAILYDEPENAFIADFVGETNLIEAVTRDTGEGRRVSVSVEGVAIAGRAREALPSGTSVVLSVRPERLNASAHKPPRGTDSNTLAGSVEDLFYFGDELKCRVRVGAGLTMIAKIPVQQARDAPALGAAVWLTWEPAYTHVFRRL